MDSAIWLYIALAIFVVGLIIAGIGVGMMISGIKEPIKEMKGSADNLKERMNNLTLETTSLQHHANELKEDMKVKSEKVSVVVDAAKGIKNSVTDLNSSVRAITVDVSSKVDRDREHIQQVNQWSNTAVFLITLLKDRKLPDQSISSYSSTPIPINKRQ